MTTEQDIFDQASSQLQTIEPKMRHVFDTVVIVDDAIELGKTQYGRRRIRPGKGGVFKGERLNGVVLSGTNWFVTRPDHIGEFNVRLTLQTDDDALIYMESRGIYKFPREVGPKIADGTAAHTDYYLREHTEFETAAEQYAWLNAIVAVGTGWHHSRAVGMSIYELL
ncbi:MAG: DUF3237 domain-containing protein [Gammaproteobacteria bacterium]|jgi:hypothetical protein|nr:DUF3237 domain-containing protein [Gammaproteobacteria bacterium]MBT4494974.1 DUF3237 domain-containing protein [Gammaproteobacteria bacterium]MBT7371721.1 DUF3237 domain-containing protein [Gammaproteobacteria bacterium]